MTGKYIVIATKDICVATDTTEVIIKPGPVKPDITANSPVCAGTPLNITLANTDPSTQYTWTGPNNFSAATGSISINAAYALHAGTYVLTSDRNDCKRQDSVAIEVKDVYIPVSASNSPIYEGEELKLYVLNFNKDATYNWEGPNDFKSSFAYTDIPNATTKHAGLYTLWARFNGCEVPCSVPVYILKDSLQPIVLYPSPNYGNFTIKGSTSQEQHVQIKITNAAGQLIHKENVPTKRKLLNAKIELPAVASGVYHATIRMVGKTIVIPFVVKY